MNRRRPIPPIVGQAWPGVDSSSRGAMSAYETAWGEVAAGPQHPVAHLKPAVPSVEEALHVLEVAHAAVDSAGALLRRTGRGVAQGQRYRHRRMRQNFSRLASIFFRGARDQQGRPVRWQDVLGPLAGTSIGPTGPFPFGGVGMEVFGVQDAKSANSAQAQGGGGGGGGGDGSAVAAVAEAIPAVMNIISNTVIREDQPEVAHRRALRRWGAAMQGLDRVVKEYRRQRDKVKKLKRENAPQPWINAAEAKLERIRVSRGGGDINSPGAAGFGNVAAWRRLAILYWDVLVGLDMYRGLFMQAGIPLGKLPSNWNSKANLKLMFPSDSGSKKRIIPYGVSAGLIQSAMELYLRGILPGGIYLPLWVFGLSPSQQRAHGFVGPTIEEVAAYLKANAVKARDVMGGVQARPCVPVRGICFSTATMLTAGYAINAAQAIAQAGTDVQAWAFTDETRRRGLPILPGQGSPGGGILKTLSEQSSLVPRGSIWSVGGRSRSR